MVQKTRFVEAFICKLCNILGLRKEIVLSDTVDIMESSKIAVEGWKKLWLPLEVFPS